jgi:hypothetical protein
MRHVKLTFVNTGESAVAELLEEDAPNTCEHVWNLLPLEGKTIHGQYSGAEVFLLVDDRHQVPPENLTQMPLPGELLYYFGAAGGRKEPVKEICVIYGRGVVARGHEGVPSHDTLFARIPGDWKYDWVDFANACRRVRFEGPQILRIERAE